LIFVSEYIQFTKSSNGIYEYELFENVTILGGDNGIKFENEIINASIEIKTKNGIKNVNKKLYDKLIIKEEKYEENNKKYILKYKYETNYNEIIGLNKICFEINNVLYPILFSQKSIENNPENNYILSY